MARQAKPHHPVTVRLKQDLFDELNRFCDDSGQSKTGAVERALEMYIQDYYKKKKIIEDSIR